MIYQVNIIIQHCEKVWVQSQKNEKFYKDLPNKSDTSSKKFRFVARKTQKSILHLAKLLFIASIIMGQLKAILNKLVLV